MASLLAARAAEAAAGQAASLARPLGHRLTVQLMTSILAGRCANQQGRLPQINISPVPLCETTNNAFSLDVQF